MRYWRANLGTHPKSIYIGERELSEGELEWTQPDNLWCMYLYLHSGLLTVNNRSYPYKPGMISVIAPGTRASHTKYSTGTYIFYLSFDLPGKGSVDVALPALTTHPAYEHVMLTFRAAIRSAQKHLEQAYAVIWNTCWTISQPIHVLRENVQLYAAEDWIRKNLHRQFQVQELAQVLDLSPSSLLRLFKSEHGTTAIEYVRYQRVQAARRLLAQTSMPIKKVASQVGIHNPQQFNKLLREYTGMSPSMYRETSS